MEKSKSSSISDSTPSLSLPAIVTILVLSSSLLTGLVVGGIGFVQASDLIRSSNRHQAKLVFNEIAQSIKDDLDNRRTLERSSRLQTIYNNHSAGGEINAIKISLGIETIQFGEPIDSGEILKYSTPVFFRDEPDNEKILKVEIYFSSPSQMGVSLAWMAVLTAIVSIIVTSIFYLILHRILTSPFRNMIADMHRYNAGDESIRFNENGPREFGFIARFINFTIDNIEILRNEQHLADERLHDAKAIAEKQARTDAMTGINNRRAFFELGSIAFSEAKDSGLPLSVVMADIDNFKKVNDTYGHAAGDQAINALVKILAENARKSDIIGRLGGEEFALILPNTTLDDAARLAERLRLQISEIVVAFNEQRFSFTASFGVAQCNDDSLTLEGLLSLSDTALYAAKQGGRNRVVKN